jgi:hypothetical protein
LPNIGSSKNLSAGKGVVVLNFALTDDRNDVKIFIEFLVVVKN